MRKETLVKCAIAAALLAAAGCGGDDSTSSPSAPTATPTGGAEDGSGEPAGTKPVETDAEPTENLTTRPPTAPPTSTSPDDDAAPVTTAPVGVQLLDFEFQTVPAGRYRVETIGAPFVIDIPERWWVQPNEFGHFVITDEESAGPGDREIAMIRPSHLADPDRPGAPAVEQSGNWPLDDITGWLAALVPGVLDGEPVDTEIGGFDAVRFDVAITDEVECGPTFCVGLATNRLVNEVLFEPGSRYRVWWIDGGDESPIVISVSSGSDPAFVERAEAVLDTVSFESIASNPIPSEGNLWEFGIPSAVPAGSVALPVGPGVTFELSEPRFVIQDEFYARVRLEDPGEVDILFPDRAFDGQPVETVDQVIDALERDPNLAATVVGTRQVGGIEATEVDFSPKSAPGQDLPSPTLYRSTLPDTGWRPPPDGTMWILESSSGIAAITAEWFDPTLRDDAHDLAAEILDSITFGG